MADKAYLDTNLAIAYVFHINSLHLKSEKVFDEYSKLFWSDFACFSSEPIDFVTFDDVCFDGADNVELLCFSSVKGKYDFN